MTDLDTIRGLRKDLDLAKARADDFEHSFKACERRHHEAVQELNAARIEIARLRCVAVEAADPNTGRVRVAEIRKELGL